MAQQNLRIAVIEPVGGHGGMDYYDFGLCGGLAKTGVDVVLHTCDETVIPAVAGFEVRHTYRGIYGKSAAWRRGVRFARGSLRAISSAVLEKRKIVHFHFFRVGSLALMNVLLARFMCRKVVITAHDVESFVSSLEVPFMSRMAYRLAHAVVAHNQLSRAELVGRLNVSPDKIAVIPHGNYLHMLAPMPKPEEAKARLEIPADAKVLLFFGQIKDVKGLDLLVQAMSDVLKKHPEALLLIAGKLWKTDFSLYQNKIDELGIADSCRKHIRYIKDDEVPLYYASAELVVLPYRHIYQSGVVLMAMSYGKAVLVSDIPGMTEIVSKGVNGFVFHQGDVGDLAIQINAALDEDDVRAHLAQQGYLHVRDKYDWLAIGESTGKCYETVLA